MEEVIHDDRSSPAKKDPRKIARKYQLELCEKAVKENIIVCLGTGCGKTHIAVLLMNELRHQFTKPKKEICIFLAPTVPLVQQQAVVIENSIDLKVQSYFGHVKHLKTHADWENDLMKYEVFVMTPIIFLQSLRHCHIRMELVALLIFDECHHAQLDKRHDYTQIMKLFYNIDNPKCPRVFGMTASPIFGKGGSNYLDYAKYINSLENILNARICSVDGNLDLEALVASPAISIYYYTPVSIYDSKFMLVYMEELEANKNNLFSILRDNYTDLKVLKNKQKSLSKVHGDVIFCLENVGLWGAVQASRILLSNVDENIIDGMKEYLNKASYPNYDFLSDNIDTIAFPIKALEEPFLSNKCSVLIEILQEYRKTPNVKCIIFAKRIIVVKSLAFIIKKMKLLDFWRCEYLVGINSGSNSRSNMNNIVERFRSGEINLLVATNVAEEGLDIPTCCLIIRFDLPESVCSFVQSRGRARSLESKYVFLVERGNEQEQKLISNFLNKEIDIKNEIKRRSSSDILDCSKETIYRVEATGASISTGCSVMLMHQYCSKLPRDQFYHPVPKFFYIDESKGIICRIILPSNSPVRQADSSPCSSKEEAKRLACFHACVQLHSMGALTDYLLPETLDDKKKVEDVESKLQNEKDDFLKNEIYKTLIPEVFTASFLKSENSIILHFYVIKFTPIPDDRKYRKFGLFFKTSLPKDAEAIEVDLHLSHGRSVKVSLVSCGTLSFTEDKIALSQNFQEMFLNILLNRMDFDSDFYTLGISESTCVSSSIFYLLLPLFGDDYAKNMNVDWETIKICLSSPIFSNPEKSICRIFPNSDSSETLRLADGLFHTRDVLNSLVFTSRTKVFYFVVEILREKNGYSKKNGPKKLSHYDFHKDKHNFILSYPTQPLLKVKRLFNFRNLLSNRETSCNEEASELNEHYIELVPEICNMKIIGFSKDIGSSLSLMPSFIHRLENFLVAIQLKATILTTMPECSQITSSRVLEALTTAKCSERFSLERLEILGDSFLKYVVSRHNFISYEALDEGQLTVKRSQIINNLHLFNLAINKNIQEYIRDELFDPEKFDASGRHCRITHNNENHCNKDVQESILFKCNLGHRFLQKKTIADVVEALIGAFLVDCGFNAAIAFLRWIGIEVSYEVENIQRICDESRLYISMIDKIEITSIENLIGYNFRHKGFLIQACIHPSYIKHAGGCYQRLEFLGDAVLDYLIISYLHSSYPELKPGHLSDLRSIIVSNDSFGRIAVRKGFHKYLLSCTESLDEAVKSFEKQVFENDSENDTVDSLSPKVLGDLIESCIGAVLLDSGFDLDHVWTIMINILEQALGLNHLANFRMNPIRELQELCQSCHLNLFFSNPVEENREFVVETKINWKEHELFNHKKNKNSKTAKRIASQELLCELEAHGFIHKCKSMSLMLAKTRKEKAKLIGFDEKPVEIDVDINEFIQFDKLCLNDREIIPTDYITGKGSSGEIKMNAKSRLLCVCSTNYWNLPSFVVHKLEGPSHLRMFTYKVILEIPENPNIILECYSEPQKSKKSAQAHAAEGIIWYLKQLGYID